jgi:hypothetical protein
MQLDLMRVSGVLRGEGGGVWVGGGGSREEVCLVGKAADGPCVVPCVESCEWTGMCGVW